MQDANSVEREMREEFECSIAGRIERASCMPIPKLVPGTYFAPVSAECYRLYRDGYFYSCIALSQAVAEAVVNFLCRSNSFEPEKRFEKNVDKLLKRGFVSDHMREKLLNVWRSRDSYHHLNSDIEQDRQRLAVMACEKLSLLQQIEEEIWAFHISGYTIVPANPKYWNGNTVFLR